MLSERGKRIVRRLITALFGVASAALFVLLWKPFFSFPEEQDGAAMMYGVIPMMWTLAAIVLVPVGLLVGRALPTQAAAFLSGLALAGATWWVWRNIRPFAAPDMAPAFIMAFFGALLLPPLLFGWLVGYGRRVRRAASALPN